MRRQPVSLASWPLINPLAGYATFVVPAAFILVLQQTLLIGIGTLRVGERHARADDDAEPVWAVLGGKAFGIRGFVQVGEMGATLADAWRSWGAPWPQALVYGAGAALLMRRRRRVTR